MRKPSSSGQSGTPRKALATVKIVKAEIGANRKPIVMHQAEIALVRIFAEEDANVNYIERKVRQEMDDNTLLIVGATGLRYTDQEGTRGKDF